MFKPKTPISGRLENSSGERIRTTDLRVMSPTSCHCSTPQWNEHYRPSSTKSQVQALSAAVLFRGNDSHRATIYKQDFRWGKWL